DITALMRPSTVCGQKTRVHSRKWGCASLNFTHLGTNSASRDRWEIGMQEGKAPGADRPSRAATVGWTRSAAGVDDDLPIHPPPGLTWHGYLVQLLHIASSIEHALMVQYLFAAYSLNDGVEDSEFRKKVILWRNLILSIAKEEMGHLLTVQNVLCLLGGPVELVRENFPWDSEFYPFEFRLERLTVGCLACYLYAEMSDRVLDLPRELK